MITTGTFSKSAREKASSPGKQQIDLMDGEALIDKIVQYGLGVKPITGRLSPAFFPSLLPTFPDAFLSGRLLLRFLMTWEHRVHEATTH